MSCGKPCIVTRDAWFAELPGDTVHFVPHDDGEVPAVAEALATLAVDEAARARLGEAARRHAEACWSPEAGARRLVGLLRGFGSAGWARRTLAARLQGVIPR
jgi:glycosyltransferase involved in cell wall biosynthesis